MGGQAGGELVETGGGDLRAGGEGFAPGAADVAPVEAGLAPGQPLRPEQPVPVSRIV